MRRLFFTSARTGHPQIFAEEQAGGELIQLTDRDDLGNGGLLPARNGRHVYFSASNTGWRVNTETYEEERLLGADEVAARLNAPVTSGGHSGLSHDDNWMAMTFHAGEDTYLIILNTASGDWEVILNSPVGHCQFCPDDANVLWYGRSNVDRLWAINRDGTNNRRLYQRKPGEWVTHESWIARTREVVFVTWPNGLGAVNVDTKAVRRLTSFNAWHPSSNRDGTLMVADTAFPDIGLQLFDPQDGIGDPTTLCYPGASCLGDHWKGPFPYEDGPIAVYAPSQTHPHPSFSPDGRYVVFTSDRNVPVRESQVYEVEIPAEVRT
jgi:oligogalacturonide lyase